MAQKCFIIADDLTGGADTGVKFTKRGFATLLIPFNDRSKVDLSKYTHQDVLLINTDSRGLSSERAFSLVSKLLKSYDEKIFPIIYKKIDSTLRGNIGYEIDAILNETSRLMCFIAPSYPEQSRTLVDGIMRVGGKPLALTEVVRDSTSPVQESHVQKLLSQQSRNKVGMIGLTHVASGHEELQKAVEEEQRKGNKIIIFDAVTRQDLANIVEVSFRMDRMPLLVGSAALAEEVAKKLPPSKTKVPFPSEKAAKRFKHIFIISGSASRVTQQQLRKVEGRKIPTFELNQSLLNEDDPDLQIKRIEFSMRISNSLSKGNAILKTSSKRLLSRSPIEPPVHLKITKTLGHIALSALEESDVDIYSLALVLIGGETAQSIFETLGAKGMEIKEELLEGIAKTHLIGGKWDGLTTITKAGSFGEKETLERIVEIIETGGGH